MLNGRIMDVHIQKIVHFCRFLAKPAQTKTKTGKERNYSRINSSLMV